MKKISFMIALFMVFVIRNTTNVFGAVEQPKCGITEVTLTNLQTGEVYVIDENAIEVKDVVNEDGTIQEVITVEVAVETDELLGGSARASVTDGGVTTRINLNINYTQSGNLYRITSVTGSFERLDTAFIISNRVVRYANYHDNESSYIKTYNPTGNSFSYPGFTNWVDTTRIQYIVGGYAKCNISRSGNAWELCCRHIIVERDYNAL